MGRLTGPHQDIGWWTIVYAVAVTPIDFGTIGLTSSSGPDVIRWGLLLPIWFLPIVLVGPRWVRLTDVMRRPPLSWLLAWAALGMVSVLWALAPRQAILIGLAMAGQILLASWYVFNAGWRSFTTAATTGLTAVVGGGVAFDLVNGTLIDGVVEGRSQGLMTSPTTQGRLAAFAVISGLAILLWNRQGGRWSPMPLVAIGTGIVAMVFAETRTAMIATVLASGYGLARRLSPLDRWVAGVSALVLVPAVAIASSAFIDISPFGERGDPTSVSGRTQIWPVIIDLIGERPILGYGWGAEEQLLIQAALDGRISFLAGTSHSIVLSPMLSGGLVGFSLLAMAIGSAVRMRRRADPWIAAMILAILIGGLTEAIVHRPSVSVLLLAGCLAALARIPRRVPIPRPPKDPLHQREGSAA